jgi:hypothetical protein
MRGVLIYLRFDMKHIQGTLSNTKNELSEFDDNCQGGGETRKPKRILSGASSKTY